MDGPLLDNIEMKEYDSPHECPDCRKITACKTLRCRPCLSRNRMSGLKYYIKNRESIKTKAQRWNRKRYEDYRWFWHLRKKYGLTREGYEALGTKCKICGASRGPGRIGRLHVDHDHKTGKVRGILCRLCNMGVGFFREDVRILRSAMDYLSEVSQ